MSVCSPANQNNLDFAAFLTKPVKPSLLYNILVGVITRTDAAGKEICRFPTAVRP